MKKLSTKKDTQRKNIATIVICVMFIITSTLAVFLSRFDWHSETVLGGFAQVGHSANIGGAISESAQKENWDYFDDTVFVGDSITYGMASYGYLSFDHVFAKVGLHQGTALTSRCVYTSRTQSYTIADALEMAKPGKVIVTIGINAIYSYKEDSFYNNYRSLLDKIKAATPDSKIIIQSIFPVTQQWAINNGKPNCNQYIAYANQKLAEIAKEYECYFLYTYEKLTDENGFLQSQYSGDGIHLSKDGYTAVFDYILTHPIVSSGYFTEIGAVRPPVVQSNTASQIVMPDIGTVSGIASSEEDNSSQQGDSASGSDSTSSEQSSLDTSSQTASGSSSQTTVSGDGTTSSAGSDIATDTTTSSSNSTSSIIQNSSQTATSSFNGAF